MKNNNHTITFRPTPEVWTALQLRSEPFIRHGKIARGFMSLIINDCLEKALEKDTDYDAIKRRGKAAKLAVPK